MKLSRNSAVAALTILSLVGAPCAAEPPAAAAAPGAKPNFVKTAPAQYGEPFPAGTYVNLNVSPGQSGNVDLLTHLGKKPIVFLYWMPNNPRSEKILADTQAAVEAAGAAKIALLPIVTPQYGSSDVAPLKARIKELKLPMPVLLDDGFKLMQQLDVHAVPSISLVDASGRLRLTNGSAMKQALEYKLDLEGAIGRLGATGKLGTYGPMPAYYPVNELVGQKCPDFTAPAINDGTSKSFSSMLARDKMNVLVFWSVDCPHCKSAMPKLNEYLKTRGDGVNLVTAARITDDATQKRTAEYCRLSGFVFPTLVDKDLQIAGRFNVVSTPTVVVIRPDGVIDSAITSGETDLGAALEAKRQAMLKGGAKS